MPIFKIVRDGTLLFLDETLLSGRSANVKKRLQPERRPNAFRPTLATAYYIY